MSRGLQGDCRSGRAINRQPQETAAVEPHLADQLLLPMALAGEGSFTTLALATHATTNIDIIRRFLDVPIAVTEPGPDLCLVWIGTV
jgi:RNA 3'-terminal phosphate cyclase (ATP)